MLLCRAIDVALMFDSATGKQHRKVSVAMDRAVAHAAPEHDQRVVENLCFLEPGDKVAELRGQKGFHDLKLSQMGWRQ